MSHARRFDHVGITVADLDTVTAFFVGLGLEVEGTRMFVEGEFLDTVIGIPDSRTEIVMLRPPDGGTRLELSSFVRPDHEPGSPAAMANELGLRNVAFEVDDLQAPSTGWQRTATGWSAASASTNTAGAWPTCADRRGSSCPWPSASADAAVDAGSGGRHARGCSCFSHDDMYSVSSTGPNECER
jgi:catechol 2,3-dioxygenase-like lactoylglutathione lyase family enzyme